MSVEQVKKNIALLQTTLQVLQSLVNEKQKNPRAVYYYEAFTLVAAIRIVHRRLEQEARLLGARVTTNPPELPECPEELRRNPQSHLSDFYQTCWGHLNQNSR